jgi:hypothetical protein
MNRESRANHQPIDKNFPELHPVLTQLQAYQGPPALKRQRLIGHPFFTFFRPIYRALPDFHITRNGHVIKGGRLCASGSGGATGKTETIYQHYPYIFAPTSHSRPVRK